jgi:arylsulfatase A-like enzyme
MYKYFFIVLFSYSICAAQTRPNIIYIMSDDHDADAISAYSEKILQTPNIDRLANEGMRFNKNFVANSICGPVRATLLTGQHSHMNGVIDNRTRFDSTRLTLPRLLQANGYQTALVGKWHLNSYPAGYDFWKILPGQGLYMEPRFIAMSGDTTTLHGYATDVITDLALEWLTQRNPEKPFALQVHHKAPHRYFLPPLKFAKQFHTKVFAEPPTLYADMKEHGTAWQMQTMSILKDMKLCSDLKVDPSYIEDIPWLKADAAEKAYYHSIFNRIPEPERSGLLAIYAERGKILKEQRPNGKELLQLKFQWYLQDYAACVASVDENVGRLLDYLDKNGLTKNTLVVYTGDQGMYLGENGWFDKRWMYDVSMQAPLLVRWPGVTKPGSQCNALTQTIDYAPTLLDAAGVPIPSFMQGLSLVSLLKNEKNKLDRPYLYYHFYEYQADHTVLPHIGIRGEHYKLIYFYTVNEWELYNLDKDPLEQQNLAKDEKYSTLLKKMKADLERTRASYQDTAPANLLQQQ